MVKNPHASAGDARHLGSNLGSIFLLGKFHGQRSLAGYTVHRVTRSQKCLHMHAHLMCINMDIPKEKMINP